MSDRPRHLYRLVAIARDGSRTVLLTGLELPQANEIRDSMPRDNAVVYFMVEHEPDPQ